jgi:predicted dehydrogenase
MQEKLPLKFVVLGAGNIGRRHIQILNHLPEAELVAVIEPEAGPRERLAELYNGPFFPSLEAMGAGTSAADVISVCSPNYLHARHALAGLAAGMHVLGEKPLALQSREGAALLAAARGAGKMVFCMQQLVLGPALQWLKQQLDLGHCGALRQVTVKACWNRDASYYGASSWRGKWDTDGGPLFTQFSHFIHALYWLFGDLEISGTQFQNRRQPAITEFEDWGYFGFLFKKGGTGHMTYSTATAPDQVSSAIEVETEKGLLRLSGQYLQELCGLEFSGLSVPRWEPLSPVALQGKFIQNVIRQVYSGEMDYSSASEGLKVVEIIENIYANRPHPLNPVGGSNC